MVDFVIDTPTHKRWWLPDRIHQYNSVIHGEHCYQTIWNGRTGELVMSLPTVKITKDDSWKDYCELAQQLANKKFAPRVHQLRLSHRGQR